MKLIVAAMEEEVKAIVDHMEQVRVCSHAGVRLYEGMLEGEACTVMKSGVGKGSCAMTLTIALERLGSVDAVINIGTAGGILDTEEVLDLVISTAVAPGESAGVREHQFRVAGAVHAAALFLQNAEDSGVRQGLDGEIFLKIFAPCKCLLQRAGIAADSGFVVEVEGSRVLGSGIFKHRVRKRKIRHGSSLRLTYWIPRQYSTECGGMQVFLLYR